MGLIYELKQRAKRLAQRGRFLIEQYIGTAPRARVGVKVEQLLLGEGDGEWCVCPSFLTRGSIAYSIGVGKDLSFDRELISRFGMEVFAFDPTPISIDWMKSQSVPEGLHFQPVGIAEFDGETEFELPVGHNVSFAMSKVVGGGDAQSVRCKVQKLSTAVATLGHKEIEILKLDIEGAEYGVIETLKELQVPVRQILIEFHHRLLPSHSAKRTEDAIRTLQELGYRIFYISPRGYEFSFIR